MYALDIDGVVANPYEEVTYRIKQAGYNVVDWTQWTTFKVYDTYPDAPKSFIKGLFRDKLVMKNAIPFEDSWAWVNDKFKTDKIVFVTYRNPDLAGVTWRWTYDWDIPVTDIIFVQNQPKSIAIKNAEDLYGEKCKAFVEDKVSNAIEARNSGIPTYIMNRNYNRYEDADGVERIDSLWDLP